MKKVAFLAMDVHPGNITMGKMSGQGKFEGNVEFKTSERNIIEALKAVSAKETCLVLEETNLARWVAQVARPYVTKVMVSDPRENALIYKSPYKKDKVDTKKLCRLARLGEIKEVYHSEMDDRAIFKTAIQHYLDMRDQQVMLKQKIKAKYRYWGVIDVDGLAVYGTRSRKKYLDQISHVAVTMQMKQLYNIMDETEQMQSLALKQVKQLGRSYPEIREFKKIPGIGDIGAHVFDAFIQTPYRFPGIRQLWRYSRLGIRAHSSDGKPLGYQRLDKSGVSELKRLSYVAWMTGQKGDNEVKRFYLRSLQRTHNHVHARLNTQRKVLAVMYGIWRKGEKYRAEMFLGSLG